jgi:nucleotide-binding universal stress UspA family protein
MSATPRSTDRPVIICHDGSSEATTAAVEYTATLLPRARAVIVTVWRPLAEESLAPAGRPPASDPAEGEDAPRRAAQQIAAEAARRATAAGLDAEPVALEARGPMWQAIELLARDRDALLVVCATNRSGVRSTLPGNLAHALVLHVSRPVLVVPSVKAATERRREAEEHRRARPPLAAQPR